MLKLQKSSAVYVNDGNGNLVGNDTGKAAILKDFFMEKFTDSDVNSIESFDGPPRPLSVPITPTVIEQAAKSLKMAVQQALIAYHVS